MKKTLAVTTLILLAAAASAEVKIEVGADGRMHMFNVGPTARHGAPAVRRVPTGDLVRLIESHSRRQRLDAGLVRAVVQVESGYNPYARSRKGAMGLMQLMPTTARHLRVGDPYDPDENLRGGTEYLRAMLDRFAGRLDLALAGYNAGPEAVERYGGIPPYQETRGYVESVLGLYRGAGAGATSALALGRKTYLSRDAAGRILLTTTPPSSR